jgi:aminodeoxyfutalosine synthase
MTGNLTRTIIEATGTDRALSIIAEKVQNNERITDTEGLLLFEKASLPFVGALANSIREKLHGDFTYLTGIFILSQPMSVFSVAIFAPIAVYTLTKKKVGN